MITIEYKYEQGQEPNAISIKPLSINLGEDDYIFLPFSFFIIKNVDIKFENYEADIILESIGKKTLLGIIIQKDRIILYNKDKKIMEEHNQKKLFYRY